MSSNSRSAEAHAWRRLYNTARWQRLRRTHLASSPLCVMCLEENRVEAASVVDHIKPHKGDEVLFFDAGNLASLCKSHHDTVKQRIERSGKEIRPIGQDGWPIE